MTTEVRNAVAKAGDPLLNGGDVQTILGRGSKYFNANFIPAFPPDYASESKNADGAVVRTFRKWYLSSVLGAVRKVPSLVSKNHGMTETQLESVGLPRGYGRRPVDGPVPLRSARLSPPTLPTQPTPMEVNPAVVEHLAGPSIERELLGAVKANTAALIALTAAVTGRNQ